MFILGGGCRGLHLGGFPSEPSSPIRRHAQCMGTGAPDDSSLSRARGYSNQVVHRLHRLSGSRRLGYRAAPASLGVRGFS